MKNNIAFALALVGLVGTSMIFGSCASLILGGVAPGDRRPAPTKVLSGEKIEVEIPYEYPIFNKE